MAVPRKLFTGTYSAVSISFNELKSSTHISLNLTSGTKELNFVNKIILPQTSAAGIITRVQFYVPKNVRSKCTVEIKSSGAVNFTHAINVEVENAKDVILIQTDKPIYKPGEKRKKMFF